MKSNSVGMKFYVPHRQRHWNTGRAVVETLSEFLKTSTAFEGYRILVLTHFSGPEASSATKH